MINEVVMVLAVVSPAIALYQSRKLAIARRKGDLEAAIVERSFDSLLLISGEGNILRANELVCNLLGYTPQELHRASLDSVLVLPASGRSCELLARIEAETSIAPESAFQAFAISHEGTRFPVSVRARSTRVEERRVFLIAVTDATLESRIAGEIDSYASQLQQTKEALQARNEHLEAVVDQRTRELEAAKNAAEEASRAKTELLATVSHELKNPLHSMLGFAELCEMNLASNPEKVPGYLQKIVKSGETMQRLLHQLLDLSRLECRTSSLERSACEMGQVAMNVADEFRAAAEAKSLRIQLFTPPEKHTASLDSKKLAQVIRNLLSNAIKFSPPGGTIHASVEAVDSELRFTIADEGPGIPDGECGKVFERFFQASNSPSGVEKGSGLGLTICAQIIEMHGGIIAATNRLESGAQFRFSIPVVDDNLLPDTVSCSANPLTLSAPLPENVTTQPSST